jgi:hypothetical protein
MATNWRTVILYAVAVIAFLKPQQLSAKTLMRKASRLSRRLD